MDGEKGHFTLWLGVMTLLAAAACDPARDRAGPAGPPQWPLPGFLREASGLAVLDGRHLLAHNDETGVIYRIALADKSIDRLVTIGEPPVEKDFEGIAFRDGRIYLTTSTGEILVTASIEAAAPGQPMAAEVIDSGLEAICEIEGLHYLDGLLLLPCKTAYGEAQKGRLTVFALDPVTKAVSEHLSIPAARLPGIGEIQPSAITADASDYYVVSGNHLLVIDRETSVARAFALPKQHHFQPEGIAVLPDGAIILVEDNRRGESRLTHYRGLRALDPVAP